MLVELSVVEHRKTIPPSTPADRYSALPWEVPGVVGRSFRDAEREERDDRGGQVDPPSGSHDRTTPRASADRHPSVVGSERGRSTERRGGAVVTVEQVRAFAMGLPRTTEALVRDRVKFRVGRIVFVAFSRDETIMGFGFPREAREAMVRSEPDKFLMPEPVDLRYHWLSVRMDAIGEQEMRELVLDAWRMCVPKRMAAAYEAENPLPSRSVRRSRKAT
jgi:hypothetical protein